MKYYMQQYFGPVSYANKKLQHLSEAVGLRFIEECLGILRIEYSWIISHQTSKNDIGRWIDRQCQNPNSHVAMFNQICVVVVPGNDPSDRGADCIFLIESNSDQLTAALLRFYKLKAFL